MLGALVIFPAEHRQDFLGAGVIVAITSAVALALTVFEFPRLAFAASIIGSLPIAERMHRVWRDSQLRSARVMVVVVVLVAGMLIFVMGAESLQAADAASRRLAPSSTHPSAVAESAALRLAG